MQEATQLLKQYFGYEEFREGQKTLIEAVCNGRDVLGIMPTGAGKSLCFQIPALMMEGITLVISPLISLMKDQVSTLNQAGIHAAFLNSSLSAGQYQKALQLAKEGRYKIIYVAPERLESQNFLEFVLSPEVHIEFLAVDESHCVSQWGQDFRPSYLKILEFLQRFPQRPVIGAYTATATTEVRDDIMDILKLKNPLVMTTGFDRKNLFFAVKRPVDKYKELLEYLKEKEVKMPGSSGIIYCLTRKNVEEICYNLREEGFSVTRYHAGLTDQERRDNQDDFIFDRKQIMIATNAFGMGIDKPDVRFVVHYNMPKNMESYYQEAGRAGRDGDLAECLLYYGATDHRTNRFFIENNKENEILDEKTRQLVMERDRERLKQMTFYCFTNECLHHSILNYFGEQSGGYCGNCGNCLMEYEAVDITKEAQTIIKCIAANKRSFGTMMIIDTLRGAKNQKVLQRKMNENSQYGALNTVSVSRLKQIVNEMCMEEYLHVTDDEYPMLELTEKAERWQVSDTKLTMKLAKEKENSTAKIKRKKVGAAASLTEKDVRLFEKLRVLRKQIASEEKVPPYMVFSDKTIAMMSDKKPQSAEEMLEVSGVGQFKLEKYGQRFLKEIQDDKTES